MSSRLRALREELQVVEQQLASLGDDAEDSRIRAMVSDKRSDAADHKDDQRHADAMAAHRARVLSRIAELEHRQDDLLDQLTA